MNLLSLKKNKMKKGLLIITSLFAGFTANAQLTQANEPNLGSQSLFLCDSFITSYSEVVGTGVTWDYSSMWAYPGEMRNLNILDATLTTHASDFPSSTKAMEIEGLVTTYFNSTPTERVSQGFVFTEPSFGEVVATWTSDEEKIMDYPFAYGNSQNDVFSGDINSNVGLTPANGNVFSEIDALGTLVLPEVTIPNVMRLHIIDSALTNVMILGDVEVIRDHYEYYDLASQNEPIFIHSKVTMQQPGGVGYLRVSTLVLSKFAGNFLAVDEKETEILSVYPNPSNGFISFKGVNSSDNIKVISSLGNEVYNGKMNVSKQINLTNLKKGVYFVEVDQNGTSTTHRVVIK